MQTKVWTVVTTNPLYDLREHNYPREEGAVFRTLQVFRCWVCGSFTNKAMTNTWPNHGMRAYCPHAEEEWHEPLLRMAEAFGMSHPEVNRVRHLHKALATNNIEGNPDYKQVWPATPLMPPLATALIFKEP